MTPLSTSTLLLVAVACLAAAAFAMQGLRLRAARRAAARAQQLRAWGDALRDTEDPLQLGGALREHLAGLAGAPATVLLIGDRLPPLEDERAAQWLGTVDDEQRAGLWLALREGHAFGPGTGRHEHQGAWYLPLRGRRGLPGSLGAVLLQVQLRSPPPQEWQGILAQAQALCDLMGSALERAQAARSAARSREEAQSQRLRNTLLAAISHDFRTPLATILGAASSLLEQGDRLSTHERQRLAERIAGEADQLGRMTDNALQLARLDTPGLTLQLDWESAEDIVGAVLHRLRQRAPQHRVRARLEPGLPLLRCHAVLLVQLLDNLVDNALKHAGSEGESPAVEILVRRGPDSVVLAVRDRGPGVPPAWRERIFEVFQRGAAARGRGAGVGLAVCRAIARAHGGDMVFRPRGHGGSSFECRLPAPTAPPEQAPGETP
jgi:two-component system sensor histidine kinase KdpD